MVGMRGVAVLTLEAAKLLLICLLKQEFEQADKLLRL